MANEIKFSGSLVLVNGYLKHTFAPGAIQITQASPGRGGSAQLIGTTEEVVDVGDVVAPGWCAMRNLDTTNYVDVGPEYGPSGGGVLVEMLRIQPGKYGIFPLHPSVVLRAKAHTAPVLLDVYVYES